MKFSVPFTNYDFYAYLVSGLAVLVAWDWALGTAELLRADIPWPKVLVIGVLAYVLGEIIASLSGFVIENLSSHLFRHPKDELWADENQKKKYKIRWFGRYYQPLTNRVRAIIDSKLGRSFPEFGEMSIGDRYECVYAIVRRDSDTAARLEESRNQYALARNISMAALLNIPVFAIAYLDIEKRGDAELLFGLSLLIFGGMWLRFMKFYSTFYAQAFRAYLADGADSNRKQTSAGLVET